MTASESERTPNLLAVAEEVTKLIAILSGDESRPYLLIELPSDIREIVYRLMDITPVAIAAAKEEKPPAELIALVSRIEDAADSDIACPFCGVVGDRSHWVDCLVSEARRVLVAIQGKVK